MGVVIAVVVAAAVVVEVVVAVVVTIVVVVVKAVVMVLVVETSTSTAVELSIVIIIIGFKGAIHDFLQSPQRRELSQHIRSSGLGATVCKSRATQSAYHVQVSCYVPLGTKGQLSYSV